MRVLVFTGSIKERRALEKQGFSKFNVVLSSYSILERADGSKALTQRLWEVRVSF